LCFCSPVGEVTAHILDPGFNPDKTLPQATFESGCCCRVMRCSAAKVHLLEAFCSELLRQCRIRPRGELFGELVVRKMGPPECVQTV